MEPRLIVAGVCAAVLIAVLVAAVVRAAAAAAWRTEFVQDRVLRWTGESAYVPTSRSHRERTLRYSGGHKPLVGATGLAPARASSVPPTPSGTEALPLSPRTRRQGTPRTAAVQRPDRCTVAVDQQASAS